MKRLVALIVHLLARRQAERHLRRAVESVEYRALGSGAIQDAKRRAEG